MPPVLGSDWDHSHCHAILSALQGFLSQTRVLRGQGCTPAASQRACLPGEASPSPGGSGSHTKYAHSPRQRLRKPARLHNKVAREGETVSAQVVPKRNEGVCQRLSLCHADPLPPCPGQCPRHRGRPWGSAMTPHAWEPGRNPDGRDPMREGEREAMLPALQGQVTRRLPGEAALQPGAKAGLCRHFLPGNSSLPPKARPMPQAPSWTTVSPTLDRLLAGVDSPKTAPHDQRIGKFLARQALLLRFRGGGGGIIHQETESLGKSETCICITASSNIIHLQSGTPAPQTHAVPRAPRRPGRDPQTLLHA